MREEKIFMGNEFTRKINSWRTGMHVAHWNGNAWAGVRNALGNGVPEEDEGVRKRNA